MNTQHILNVASKYISGINEIETNIFKGTLTVENKPAGVYYFDLNNKPVEDFEAYQERLLADEFYAHPGNLQWNYYLFLLNDQLGPKVKEHIEKNDKYARKFVLTEAEFNDFFTLEKSSASIRPNIVAEWKKRLDDVGLQDVYTTRSYVDMVAQFKTSSKIPLKKVQDRNPPENNDKIQFINRLTLRPGYRPFPIQRDFDFGKVNLFRGINGAGKTSLFEAIEAMICGRCLRNPQIVMAEGCIEAEFNNSRESTTYNGTNNRLYIERDFNWYATDNSKKNGLFNSFNRFNFFNADAAHTFSSATTEKEASDALFSIILGTEYNYISERNLGTLDRLRPDYNKLKDEMTKERQRLQRAERIISNYKEPTSLSLLRASILAAYRELNFKSTATSDELATIEERNNQLRPILNNFLSNEASTLTLTIFEKDFAEFQEKGKQLTAKEGELKQLTENLVALEADEKQLDNKYNFISRCLTYIQDVQLMKLNGLQTSEGIANLQLSKIRIVKNLMSDIENGNNALDVDKKVIQDQIRILNEQIKNDEGELKKVMNNLGQLETILRQIKSHGKEFLTLDHNTSDCPLCQAVYSRDELENRIGFETNNTNPNETTNFDTLRLRIDRNKGSLQEHELSIQKQLKLDQAYITAFPGEVMVPVREKLTRLHGFTFQEEKVAQELYEITELIKYAKSSGRSEKEYNELKFACSQMFPDGPSFEYGQATEFQNLLVQTTTNINGCKTKKENASLTRTAIGNEIKTLLGVSGITLYPKDIQQLFQKEQARISSLQNDFAKLQTLLEIRKDDYISKFIELSEVLDNNLNSLREEQKVQFEFETAKKDKDESSAFIARNAEKVIRYERALETLRALTGDEASAYVSAFFAENFQEIVDIFKSIHTPKEFKTLEYTTDGRLMLITDDEEKRSISQISTGQRSALALSIFLSLNGKLTNGPDIIMFDDPVSFIDDLNALSFLDHLRVHTLRTNRQIFFATANMRLAGLFEKKFGFLGDDFRRFDFDRNEDESSVNLVLAD
jgi:exonuclease SbcC